MAVTEIDPTLAAGLARRFRIVRQLGAGGVDAVFLAEQIAAGNRPVALKVLLRKLLDDPDFLQRFRNEAASTGRIRHPASSPFTNLPRRRRHPLHRHGIPGRRAVGSNPQAARSAASSGD